MASISERFNNLRMDAAIGVRMTADKAREFFTRGTSVPTPPANGSFSAAWSGLKENIVVTADNLGSSASRAAKGIQSLLMGGSNGAKGLWGAAKTAGRVTTTTGMGLFGKTARGVSEIYTVMPKTMWSVTALLGVGAVVKWWENRKAKRELRNLRAMNDAVEAHIGPVDDTRARTAALAAGRQETSARVGQYNPDGSNFRETYAANRGAGATVPTGLASN